MVTPMAKKYAQGGRAKVPLVIVLVTVVVVAVFARLGFWQLDRAQEKIELLRASEHASKLPALTQLGRLESELYRQVELSGKFDFERQFLRDNIVFEKQVGYEVLTPFTVEPSESTQSHTILVNRGWLPLGASRDQRPDIVPENDGLIGSVEGILVKPSRGFTLGTAIDESEQQWPLVLQFLDYEVIAAKLDKIALLPAVVILNTDHPYSYTYSWKAVADGPEKHYGYAFQWFAMLAAVLVLFIYLNFFKKDEPERA